MTRPVRTVVPMFDEPDTGSAGGEHATWDAFWAEVKGTKKTTIRGVEVRVPTGLTLGTQHRYELVVDTGGVHGFAPIAVELFRAPSGARIEDLWERWDAAGMELDELHTVVAWGMSHAKGTPITFAEAHRRAQEAKAGKAARRPTSSSAATGGRSKPASRRTASQRTPSPA